MNDYVITGYNRSNGYVTVRFSGVTAGVALPIVDGAHPTGIELDSHIRSSIDTYKANASAVAATNHAEIEALVVADPVEAKVKANTALATAKVQIQIALRFTDWTQLSDYTGADKAAWATYRAALRDVKKQPGYPDAFALPVPPSVINTPTGKEVIGADGFVTIPKGRDL